MYKHSLAERQMELKSKNQRIGTRRRTEPSRRAIAIFPKGFCENCGKELNETYGSGRFCGQFCAHSFITKAARAEISQKIGMAQKKVWKKKTQKVQKRIDRILSNTLKLEMALKCSWGFSALCENLGIAVYYMPIVRKWVRDHRLDISHFHLRSQGFVAAAENENRLQSRRKAPDELVFVKDSLFPEAAKTRFGERTPNVCAKCGVGTVWQNEPLRLQTHHIDGDTRNCCWENFQKLCPNCHTQTENWGIIKSTEKFYSKARKYGGRNFSQDDGHGREQERDLQVQ